MTYEARYVFDVETFPNFFCATFKDLDTQKKYLFKLYNIIDHRESLQRFLNRNIEIIGYNNIVFDTPVLIHVLNTLKLEPAQAVQSIYHIAQKLISEEGRFDKELKALRYPRNIKFHQVDLMKLMAFDMLGVSLKQIAINLKWPKIQDLPLPYDHWVMPSEAEIIYDYNWNDVGITEALYKAIQPQIKLRQDLSAEYGVDLTSSSDSNMANRMLDHIYVTQTGADLSVLKDLRTSRSMIEVRNCIGKNIEFVSAGMKMLLGDLCALELNRLQNFSFSKSVRIKNTVYDLGVGGIHSQDKAGKFVAEDGVIIRDADVASFYPNIVILNELAPDHLNKNDFIRILKQITTERIAAKKAGNKVKADGLKITINSIFGKLGSDTYWLQDEEKFFSVTISGQLYLLMLIEALEQAGIEVISANTDGIVARFPAEKEAEYNRIAQWWQEKTGFELEFSDYALYVRSDVNNYLTKKKKGEIKTKGRYVQEIELKKGYKHPIVPRCLFEYFVNGKPIEGTLAEATDVLDFCVSQKTGSDFQLVYRNRHGDEPLQKTNRFYVSTKGGSLVKVRKSNGKEAGLFVGERVQILNDFDPTVPISEYPIDFDFYKQEVQAIIDEIEPPPSPQLSLF